MSWLALPGGTPGLVPLEQQILSGNVTAVDFTQGIDSTYGLYIFTGTGIKPDIAAGGDLSARFSTDAGVSFDAGAADYSTILQAARDSTTNWSALVSTGSAEIPLHHTSHNIGGDAGESANFIIFMGDPSDVNHYTRIMGFMFYKNASAASVMSWFTGDRLAAQDTDALRILISANNIAQGTFSSYGVRNS